VPKTRNGRYCFVSGLRRRTWYLNRPAMEPR
jgi:hypothetical protein